ncbi:MAG: cytochrome P460 family protein [Rhodocyclaceae bacterium]|nr:cytochrome P460 family protein [Rhodocyclaceae bacterium]
MPLIPRLRQLSTFALLVPCFALAAPPSAPNGIELPSGYKDWRVIAPSHREDNKTLRVILGNDVAIKAARAGDTHPWPEGSILAKLVWKDGSHAAWPSATVPAEFVHAEFMIKDSARFKDTGGWGFARWKGLDQVPHGSDASFVNECFGCHQPVREDDYVFTHPARLP